MTIYFHIGTPKTGTTSLQQFLAANREALAKQGYGYPSFLGQENHTRLAGYAVDSERILPVKMDLKLTNHEKVVQFRSNLRNAFKREIQAKGDYIFSNEHCSGSLFDKGELTRLKKLLTSTGQEVRLILYCREPVAAFSSRYSTLLKIGHTNKMRAPNAEQLDHFYNYLSIADRWAAVFGRDSLTVRLFSREALSGGDIRRDFLEVLGIPAASLSFDYAADEFANKSLDYLVASFLLQMNKRVPRYLDKTINPARADLGGLCQLISRREGILVPEEIAHSMTAALEAPLARFNQEYLGGQAVSPFAPYGTKGKQAMRPLNKKEYLDVFADIWEAKIAQEKSAVRQKLDEEESAGEEESTAEPAPAEASAP